MEGGSGVRGWEDVNHLPSQVKKAFKIQNFVQFKDLKNIVHLI